MNRARNSAWFWTRCAAAASVAALAACGGDGGGDVVDDGGDDPAPSMPAIVAFSGGQVEDVPLTVSVGGLGLSVAGFHFGGRWDRAANRYTLPAGQTDVRVDFGPAGLLATAITATTTWVGAGPPSSGTISAQSFAGTGGTPLFTGTASAMALSDTAVQLSWNGTTPPTTVNSSWDGFLGGDLTTDWENGLQAGVGMLAMGVQTLQLALEQFVYVNAQDAALKSAGPAGITSACAGGAGTRKVVWNDSNGDGALGPGDGFTVTFSACRVDLPGDIDQVLDGQIAISNYIENSSPFSIGGRVNFVRLQQTESDTGMLTVSTSGSLQLFLQGN
jgi:hypothetical protein